MKIRTQFIANIVLLGILGVLLAASMIITRQRITWLGNQQTIAGNIERGVRELSYLSNDYLLHQGSQQRARWEGKLAEISDGLSSLELSDPRQQALADSIAASKGRLESIFGSVASSFENAPQPMDPTAEIALIEVSWSRMEVENQGMVFNASLLSQELRNAESRLRGANNTLGFVILGAFGASLVSSYFLTYRRTLNSVGRLQAGAEVVGAGDLSYSIPVKHEDEIGDLCRAFNQMTSNLRETTASKQDLEQEVAERKLAEDKLSRQKAIQEGINQILKSALTCETAKEVGETCLTIAQELTGSTMGFVGELNSEGRLDDIAMSDPGWALCRIGAPGSQRRLPVNLAITGIYGAVIKSGEAFYTNDPATHPSRVGLPEGHPPLSSFLGVPLRSDDRVVGMVGLGNREGGYRIEDQEAAEALAPIIVEALERKRAETRLRHQEERYHGLMDSMLEGCQIIGSDWRYLYANEAAAEHRHCTREELLGHTLSEVHPGIEDTEAFARIQECMTNHTPQEIESLVRYSDGSEGWLQLSMQPVPEGIFVLSLDITERKEAEKALQRAKEQWERTFDSVPDLIAILDERHRVVRANQAMAKRLGCTPEACVGAFCYKVVHGASRPPSFCPHVCTLVDGEEHLAEVHEDKLGGDFLVSTTPLHDDEGNMIGSVHVARDITERKRAEQVLRDAHEQLELQAEELKVANEELAAQAEELTAQTEELQQQTEELLTTEEELRRARDGLEIRVRARTAELAETNRLLYREVEERRQAEQAAVAERRHLDDLMNALPIYMVLLTPDYHAAFANERFTEFFGESHGQRCYEFLFGRNEPCENCETFRVLKDMKPRQWEWTGPNGRIYLVNDYPFVDTDGSPKIMKTGIDITARKHATSALIQAEKLGATGRMAAVVAHEINNPMQSVLGCLSLAREVLASGGNVDKYLSLATSEIQRVARLVSGMRDAYRQGDEKRQVVSPEELAQRAIQLTERQLETAGVEPRVTSHGNLASISVVPDRIQQVFLNLILNAAEAMPEGGTLDIVLLPTNSPRGTQIRFIDTGTGIPPHVLQNLFDPFLTTKQKGSGLGLFVCKTIIDQHGGTIGVETEEGKGTTFTIWLPAASA